MYMDPTIRASNNLMKKPRYHGQTYSSPAMPMSSAFSRIVEVPQSSARANVFSAREQRTARRVQGVGPLNVSECMTHACRILYARM